MSSPGEDGVPETCTTIETDLTRKGLETCRGGNGESTERVYGGREVLEGTKGTPCDVGGKGGTRKRTK